MTFFSTKKKKKKMNIILISFLFFFCIKAEEKEEEKKIMRIHKQTEELISHVEERIDSFNDNKKRKEQNQPNTPVINEMIKEKIKRIKEQNDMMTDHEIFYESLLLHSHQQQQQQKK